MITCKILVDLKHAMIKMQIKRWFRVYFCLLSATYYFFIWMIIVLPFFADFFGNIETKKNKNYNTYMKEKETDCENVTSPTEFWTTFHEMKYDYSILPCI